MSDPIHGGVIPMESTPNYRLPLWKANTITSWLQQMNYAMLTIDTIMHNLTLRTSIDGSVPQELFSTVEQLEKDVAEFKEAAEAVTNLQTQMANVLSDVATLRINYNNVDTRLTTVESAIQNLQSDIDKVQNNVNINSDEIVALENRVKTLENSSS